MFDDSGGKVYLLDPSVDRLEFEYLDVNKKEKKKTGSLNGTQQKKIISLLP